MRIRVALHYDLASPAGAEAPFAGPAAHAARAEAGGADVAWVAERPTVPGALPAALPACAAIAARTGRLHVGTAVLPLALHHPLRVAEDASTLDVLSDGRFELGVGLGDDPGALPGFGVASEERVARLEEAVALLRRAWREDPLSFEGRHFRVAGLSVVPRPSTPGGPLLWVGAGAEAAQRRAASVADGLLLAPGASPAPFLRAFGDAGRRGARLAVALDPVREPGAAARSALAALREAADGEVAQLDLMLRVTDLALPVDAALATLREIADAGGAAGS